MSQFLPGTRRNMHEPVPQLCPELQRALPGNGGGREKRFSRSSLQMNALDRLRKTHRASQSKQA